MQEDQPKPSTKFTADWFMRGALSRIGDTLDRFTGRTPATSSSIATSELIERLKKLLDAEARDVEGKGRVVPHNIRLFVQWDRFGDSEDALATLQRELTIAAADHVNDSLYYTFAPLNVEVRPDYFTEGVRLIASFEQFADDQGQAEMNVTMPAIDVNEPVVEPEALPEPKTPALILAAIFTLNSKEQKKGLKLAPGGRISVGRTGGNDLVIDDISVSKFHAAITSSPDGSLSIADTGSTNGTFVGGKRIAYAQVTPFSTSDRVTFGAVDVRFELDETAEKKIDDATLRMDSSELPGGVAPDDTLKMDHGPDPNTDAADDAGDQ